MGRTIRPIVVTFHPDREDALDGSTRDISSANVPLSRFRFFFEGSNSVSCSCCNLEVNDHKSS